MESGTELGALHGVGLPLDPTQSMAGEEFLTTKPKRGKTPSSSDMPVRSREQAATTIGLSGGLCVLPVDDWDFHSCEIGEGLHPFDL